MIFLTAIKEVLDKIESAVALYQVSCKDTRDIPSTIDQRFEDLNVLLKEAAVTPPVIPDKIGYQDRLVYIYTSGTTGLPKAAVITNSRLVSSFFKKNLNERIY